MNSGKSGIQTILGAGGAVGIHLANHLSTFAGKVRLVGRNPKRIRAADDMVQADLLNPEAVMKAVAGSDVAYLVAGLPYKTNIWEHSWPIIMENVLRACASHRTRLVFFDNVYMYDPDSLNGMDETTSFRPVSKKGDIRARIAQMLMDAVERGHLEGLIVRSADFYGPSLVGVSILTEIVFNNLAQNKKAQWLGSVQNRHSFTYVPDAAHATSFLGNTDSAYNQVWHAPTAVPAPTGAEWVHDIAAHLGVQPKFRNVSKNMVRLLGLFNSQMKELYEMMYQYDRDYVFDSQKIEKQYGLTATPYHLGIQTIVESDYLPSS
jgi:nucleoside-diphosphate-sugar epimerase